MQEDYMYIQCTLPKADLGLVKGGHTAENAKVNYIHGPLIKASGSKSHFLLQNDGGKERKDYPPFAWTLHLPCSKHLLVGQ